MRSLSEVEGAVRALWPRLVDLINNNRETLTLSNNHSGGSTLETNIELVQNNLDVGIEILEALGRLENCHDSDGSSHIHSDIIVLGGTVVDSISSMTSSTAIITNTSTVGKTIETHGGVGRNVAEAAAKTLAGQPGVVSFYTALGGDSANTEILAQLENAGVRTKCHMVEGENTAKYSAFMKHDGDLLYAVADMSVFDAGISRPPKVAVENAKVLVFDGNCSVELVESVLEDCDDSDIIVCFEPTSVEKAAKFENLWSRRKIDFIFPSEIELLTMANMAGVNDADNIFTLSIIVEAANALLEKSHSPCFGNSCFGE